jgi:hypothetical protein
LAAGGDYEKHHAVCSSAGKKVRSAIDALVAGDVKTIADAARSTGLTGFVFRGRRVGQPPEQRRTSGVPGVMAGGAMKEAAY